MSRPRLRELIQRAISDDDFARSFLADPGAVASEYNLTEEQVEKVRELAAQGLFQAEVEAHDATPAYY
ncbi:Os1348 family NHLP clan protein [Peterkaempfera sp. SMS 1(5)a]|uniref:Os1348 family NHLP clan protein n=1 Tax=Peterkaempfera podocarpi TaxID=3232308 RepID=UPI00366B0164